MADLRVYTDDGDQDGGTLGYSGFTGASPTTRHTRPYLI